MPKALSPAAILTQHRKSFEVADRNVEEALFATAMGIETAVPSIDEVLEEVRRSLGRDEGYDEAVRLAGEADIFLGNIQATHQTIGLLVGLAFGLRLRGVR